MPLNRGIYSAATGMLAQQFVLDAVAGNLANSATPGFKQDVPTFRALHEMAIRRVAGRSGAPEIGRLGLGAAFDRTVTDLSAGALQQTGGMLDLALAGEGFFVVQTPRGVRYTRAGQFQALPAGKAADGSPASWLADMAGNRVLGEKGPIALGAARSVVVAEDGTVTVDGAVADRIRRVHAPAAALVKEGGNLFSISGTTAPSSAPVRQGFLEASNVSGIDSMVRMIALHRAYEAAQRAVTTQDDTLGRAVNEVMRV